jgi:hypothetical protein
VGRLIGQLLGIAVLAAALFVGAAVWAVYYPDRAWKILRPVLISSDIQTSWASARFHTQRSNWKKWRIEWSLTGLKIERAAPKLQMTMDVKFNADITLFSPRTEVRVELLEIVSTAPAVIEGAAASPSDRNPYEKTEDVRKHLHRLYRLATLEKFNLSFPELLVGDGKTGGMKLKLEAVKPGASQPQTLDFKVAGVAETWAVDAAGTFNMPAFAAGKPFLAVGAAAKGVAWNMSGQFDVAMPEQQLQSAFKLKGSSGKSAAPTTGTAEGNLSVGASQIKVSGTSDLTNLPGGISSVKGAAWSLDLPLWPGVVLSHLAGQTQVTAPVELSFIRPETRAILEKNCGCKWPTVLKATMDGKVWASHVFDSRPEERPVATLTFKFEPVNNSLLVLNLNGELRIVHSMDQSFKFSPSIDASVKLPNFQVLKGLLEANRVMVPAPFDILQGSIEATVKTNLWQSDKGLVIPIDANANLASSEQKVNVSSKINLYIPDDFKSMDVMFDFTVNDFIVEMPPLDPIHGFPQLTKDSRLQLSPDEVVRPDAFKFRLMYGVRTSKPGAVRLMSKLAQPAIPVSLDLDRTAKGDTLGTVKTEPFDLNYLHRSMHVDQLRAILDDRESADFAVDGLIRVVNSQYKISIAISGSLRSPLIKLSSEPELSRSDIISVLLYERTSDQLVSADRETAGSFEAAVSDRAIGLLGLWVFASTPIRSFSYNPLTKVYTATVRLSEGTTASIGTNWEEAAQLEVRKRVTRRWVLTASWAPSETKEQMGKLVLQWEKRF